MKFGNTCLGKRVSQPSKTMSKLLAGGDATGLHIVYDLPWQHDLGVV